MREQLDEAWKSKEEPVEEVVEEEKVSGADIPDEEGDKGGDGEGVPKEPKEGEEDPDKEGKGDEEPADKKAGKEQPDKKPDEAKSGGDSGKKPNGKDASAEDLKAPASWKPATREHWAKIPKEAQQEILRREREIDTGLQQASGFRKVANEYFNLVKPFESLLRARNHSPSEAITNLLTTAARLQTGTKQQKAEVIAEILDSYDVDIPMLDQILSGKVKPGSDESAKFTSLLDEKLKPVLTFIDGVKGHQTEVAKKGEEEVSQGLEAFKNDPKNEFFEDVREDMADIMEVGANRGRMITLQEAYDKACQLHPDVSKIVAQRKARASNELDGKKLARKTRAASSIRGNPEEDGTKKATDIRGAISQAWDETEQR
jgi:hypothetical protein